MTVAKDRLARITNRLGLGPRFVGGTADLFMPSERDAARKLLWPGRRPGRDACRLGSADAVVRNPMDD